jgi:hypothetical protein
MRETAEPGSGLRRTWLAVVLAVVASAAAATALRMAGPQQMLDVAAHWTEGLLGAGRLLRALLW